MVASATRPWLLLSMGAAALAMLGSAVALADQQVYDQLTTAFLSQALAQDLVNLFVVSPAIVVLAVLALRGSVRAYPLWLGTLLFTAYNYVIYTVAIPSAPSSFPGSQCSAWRSSRCSGEPPSSTVPSSWRTIATSGQPASQAGPSS